jgi:imidazole glycerol-phosphate synthase subunit HisF
VNIMLKKRVIASVVLKNGIVVQSIGFAKYLPIGRLEIALEFLSSWGIDEIVVVDISATRNHSSPSLDLIRKAAKKCLVPLTVGGGIQNLEQAQQLSQSGADKVLINQLFWKNPKGVTQISEHFGKQFVMASVDVLLDEDGEYRVYDYCSQTTCKIPLFEHIQFVQDCGAGEILVNAVHKDGRYTGFDLRLSQMLTQAEINVPVIIQGGALNADSWKELFNKTDIQAAAASNFFHFTEHSVQICKSKLKQSESELSLNQSAIRLETSAQYTDFQFDEKGRILKKSDEVLENMLFEKIEVELI